MSREILFRGKDIKGNWYEGLLAHNIAKDEWYISNKAGISTAYQVRPETIGQYTGLTDKNGTKIFEGDILDFGGRNFRVFWNDESYQWQVTVKRNGFDFPVYDGIETHCPVECVTLGWIAAEVPIIGSMSTEIVGNVYDNPELIEK